MNAPIMLDRIKEDELDHNRSTTTSPGTGKRTYKVHRKPQSEQAYQAKQRSCLMCKDPFPSAWPGERICKRCKESAAWRSG